ncbi:hypothetical protein ZWY2020_059194 [Hordeum vulgare]|nr:hypothetical protein ZWY2020_059194 [Hordeum vulgare]
MDAIYRYDEAANATAHEEKPRHRPHHFRRAGSPPHALKMVAHAAPGGTIEIMDLMRGKFCVDSIIAMDAFKASPSRAPRPWSTPADAYEYMVEYSTINNCACRPQILPPKTVPDYFWSSDLTRCCNAARIDCIYFFAIKIANSYHQNCYR